MKFLSLKLAIGFVLSFAALATMGLLSYLNTRNFIETNRWVEHTYRVIESLEEIRANINQAETGERSYVITGKEADLEPFRNADRSLGTRLDQLRALVYDNPTQMRRLAVLVPVVEERLAFMRETIELRRKEGFATAQQTIREGRGTKTMSELRGTIRSMINEEKRLLSERHRRTEADGRRLIAITLLGSVLALTLMSLAGYLLRRDLIQRRNAEAILRRQSDIIDNIHDSVVSTDLDGKVTSWNHGAERLFGYRPDEAVGRHISFVYPEDQYDFLEREVIEPLKQKGSHEVEVWMQRKDGKGFWAHLSLSLLKNDAGTPIGMIGYSIDITPRKLAEEKAGRLLRELNERVKELTALHETARLLQSDPEAAVEVLRRTSVILIEAGQEPGSTAVRIRFGEIEHASPNFNARLPCQTADFATTAGKQGKIEFAYAEAGARSAAERLLADKRNLVESLAEMLAAYFERKAAEARAEASTRALVDRNRELWRLQEEIGRVEPLAALGRITGTIAHELGTPLNSILGYSQLLGQEPLPEKTRQRIKVIETEVRRMVDIINHYLTSTRGSLEKSLIDMNRLIAQTISLLEPIFDQHHVELMVSKAPLPRVEGDEASLQRVLINLFNNAVDAMPEGGKLTVSTRAGSHPRGAGPAAVIRISDSGTGISPDLLPRIFDMFVTTKPPGKGTGLGLAVSQEIVKEHGGTMNIASDAGTGTRVEIFLPAAEEVTDDSTPVEATA